jgi:hypothetical protein
VREVSVKAKKCKSSKPKPTPDCDSHDFTGDDSAIRNLIDLAISINAQLQNQLEEYKNQLIDAVNAARSSVYTAEQHDSYVKALHNISNDSVLYANDVKELKKSKLLKLPIRKLRFEAHNFPVESPSVQPAVTPITVEQTMQYIDKIEEGFRNAISATATVNDEKDAGLEPQSDNSPDDVVVTNDGTTPLADSHETETDVLAPQADANSNEADNSVSTADTKTNAGLEPPTDNLQEDTTAVINGSTSLPTDSPEEDADVSAVQAGAKSRPDGNTADKGDKRRNNGRVPLFASVPPTPNPGSKLSIPETLLGPNGVRYSVIPIRE